MRLSANTSNSVEVSGLTETRDFTIRANGKAFRILIDGLYADKVAAVIRELSTNAYDAHLAIGRGDKPFIIRLPTVFSPTFVVRDFGVSMTHEQTMRLMSTVFESTKDESNNQVGAFGLGSKSPFALVDSFSLNVIKDGERRSYSTYIGPDGVPTIALLGRDKTTELDGVEFQMTIATKDVSAFKARALRILQWFPTPPTVYEGTVTLKIATPPVLVSGKGWQLLDANRRHNTGYSGGAMARQGCGVYPLNANAVPHLSQDHTALMQAPLVIDFAIGSLDVAASREALSYDVQTCKNIVARLNTVTTEVVDIYGKAIRDAPTLWEAGKKRLDINSTPGLPRSLVHLVSNTKWRGTTAPTAFAFAKVMEDLEKAGKKVEGFFWDSWRINPSALTVYMDEHAQRDLSRSRWDYGNDDLAVYFTLASDRPTYEGRRIRMAIEELQKTPNTSGYLARHRSIHAALFVVESEADAQVVLDAMGNPPSGGFTKDLPAPVIAPRAPPAKRGTTKKEEVKVREVVYASTATSVGGYIVEAEKVIPLDGDAVYIFSRDGVIQGLPGQHNTGNAFASYIEFCAAMNAARSADILPKGAPIYVVSTVYQKRVEAFGGWKKLVDGISTSLVDIDAKLIAEAEERNLLQMLNQDRWVQLFIASPRYTKFAEDLKTGTLHAMHKLFVDKGYAAKISAYKSTHGYPPTPYMDSLWSLRLFGVDSGVVNDRVQVKLNKSTALAELFKTTKACDDAYPLIAGWEYYRLTDQKLQKHIMQYIEALDHQRAALQTPAPVTPVQPASP